MKIIIDGNNQAFVSNQIASLSNKDGFPTQAISGFLSAMRYYLSNFPGTTSLSVAFDGGRSETRMALMPEYKAGRGEHRTPDQQVKVEELKRQMPVLRAMIRLLGIPIVEGPGIEADDLIALLVKGNEKAGVETLIVSSDKDFFQLVTPLTSIFTTTVGKRDRHITVENFEANMGLAPSQWLDFRALMGDKSDCVPGVKGVGEKTAMSILKEWGSYEAFYKLHREYQLAGKKLKAIEQKAIDGKDDFELSKRMMNLRSPEMIGDPGDICVIAGIPDKEKLVTLLNRLSMDSALSSIDVWLKDFPAYRYKEAA